MSTRLVIECIGSRGDVEPYLALGSGLQRAGFDVAIATHDTFRDLVRENGLEHRTVAGDPSELVNTAMGLRWQDSGQNPVAMAKRLRELAHPLFDAYLADTEAALDDADAVVFSVLGVAAYHVAELRSIPAIGAWLAPMSRTRDFPNPMVPFLPAHLSHILFEQTMWQFVRRDMNRWREELGLAPFPWHGPFRTLVEHRMPVIYGFSPTLVPRPGDWPPHIVVSGAWFRRRVDPLSAELESFLDAGPQPVYIGFGSRADQEAEARTEEVVRAIRIAGVRAVLSAGWGGLAAPSSDDIHVVGEENHQLLFPQCAVIVHHGGAGTTHTAARSGTPSVVVPHWADQFFWADRIATVGAGPRPLRRNRLTADALALRIDDARRRHATRAAHIGEALRRERGVDRAVEIVERLLAS